MFKRRLNKTFTGRFVCSDTKVAVLRESSTVDTFYKTKSVSSDDGKDCVHYVDPIYLLFNEQRLKLLGADSAMKYLESMLQNFKSNPLTELRKQCSDEDLLLTIKSRHLQSPSEILAWTRYMSNNMDEFKSNVEAVKAQYDAQLKEQQSKEVVSE